MPKRYNTPHRSRVVKTRLSEDEYADFTARLAPQKYFRNGYPKIFNVTPVFCPQNVRCKVRGCLEPARPHRKNFKRSRTNAEKMPVVK